MLLEDLHTRILNAFPCSPAYMLSCIGLFYLKYSLHHLGVKMALMAKCACGHVAVDVCDTGSGDSDSGEGNRRSGTENGMNRDTENNNRSKTAGAEHDTRTDDTRDGSWVGLEKGMHGLT